MPELGTFTAARPPIVVLTSNRSRDLHDALRRRCLYHWIEFPAPGRAAEILRRSVPGGERAADHLGHRVRRRGSAGWTWTRPPAWPRRSTGWRRCPRSAPASWSGTTCVRTLGAIAKTPDDREPLVSSRTLDDLGVRPDVARPTDPAPALLRGVDRAAFAVAFAERLRAAGVPVGLTAVEDFTRALGVAPAGTRSRALLDRPQHAACAGTRSWRVRRGLRRGVRRRDVRARPARCAAAPRPPPRRTPRRRVPAQPSRADQAGAGCPGPRCRRRWTPPRSRRTARRLPAAAAQRPGGAGRRCRSSELDARQLAAAGRVAGGGAARGGRRAASPAAPAIRPGGHGSRCGDARRGPGGPAGSRSSWSASGPVDRPRRVVMLCDVSRSMQAHGHGVPAPDARGRGAHADARCSRSPPG